MSETTCTDCGRTNSSDAGFCAFCGTNLSPSTACMHCGFANPQGSIFCSGCGQSMVMTADQELAQEGRVEDGVWDRGEGEFVKAVQLSEMKSHFLQSRVQVPPDSIGIITVDGQIEGSPLPPGLQLGAGRWAKAWGFIQNLCGQQSKLDRSIFYLVATRPILFPPMVVTAPSGEGSEEQIQATVQGFLPSRSDTVALAAFFRNVVGSKISVGRQDLIGQLRPKVDKAVRDAIAKHGSEYIAAESSVMNSLRQSIGETTGFEFRVELTPKGKTVSMETILGLYEMPKQVHCTNWECEHMIMPTEGFCGFCGQKQEGRDLTPAKEKLYTADGVEVEVHAIIRAQGQGDLTQGGMLTGALNGAASNAIRNMDFDALTQGGLKKVNAALTATAREVVENLGFRLLGIQLIDLRSVQSDWLLDARNQLTKARKQLELDAEWADVNKQEIDLQAVVLGNVLLRAEVEADHAFDLLKLELHDDFRRLKESNKYGLMTAREMAEHDYQMDDIAISDLERRQSLRDRQADLEVADHSRDQDTAFRKDEVDMSDEERRQDHAQRAAEMRKADAQREAVTDVNVDQSLRARDRILAQEDHTDIKSDVERERELRSMMREDENSELSHQLGQEKAAADHSDELARQGMQLDSDRRRMDVDDVDYAANKAVDTEHRRDVLATEREGVRQQMKLDKLKAMAEMEASMSAREDAAKLERMQQGQSMDAAQIMAMAALEGRQLSDAEAQALAAASSDGDRVKAEAAEAAKEEQMALMMKMMEMNQSQGEQKDQVMQAQQAQMMAMMQQMMQTQQAVTQTALDNASTASSATNQAYKDSAAQAGHSASQAMQSMSHVVGNQAIANTGIKVKKPGDIPNADDVPQADAAPVCKKCGLQAPMGARFCSKGCGALG